MLEHAWTRDKCFLFFFIYWPWGTLLPKPALLHLTLLVRQVQTHQGALCHTRENCSWLRRLIREQQQKKKRCTQTNQKIRSAGASVSGPRPSRAGCSVQRLLPVASSHETRMCALEKWVHRYIQQEPSRSNPLKKKKKKQFLRSVLCAKTLYFGAFLFFRIYQICFNRKVWLKT